MNSSFSGRNILMSTDIEVNSYLQWLRVYDFTTVNEYSNNENRTNKNKTVDKIN